MAESSDQDKRPQFGNRILTDPKNVFEHNAWDNVVWDEEQEAEARRQVQNNSQTLVAEEDRDKYEQQADVFWDDFYNQHKNRFFKDRHWLFTEFPELASSGGLPEGTPRRTLDPGTSAAAAATTDNSPALSSESSTPTSATSGTHTHGACGGETEHSVESGDGLEQQDDTHSEKSEQTKSLPEVVPCSGQDRGRQIDSKQSHGFPGEHAKTRFLEVGCGVGNTIFPVLQTNDDANMFIYGCDLSSTAIQIVKEHADYNPGRCHAFVCDVSNPDAVFPFPKESLDLVILIFVLSAIHPDKFQDTINRIASHLKPGGLLIFRDYGRYDMAQLRFKNGKCLQDNFYVRGDGTRVYFFTQEELRQLFVGAGLEEEQNMIDRRLQVNRGRQLKMYRVWIQCKYRKPKQ